MIDHEKLQAESVRNKRTIKTYNEAGWEQPKDFVAVEAPLTMYVNGEEFATLLCTPSYIEDMAYGFLLSEGIIRKASDVTSLNISEEKGLVYAELTEMRPLDRLGVSKRVIGSCCGKSRQFYFENDRRTAKTVTTDVTITPQQIMARMRDMQENSQDFHDTGGLHNVGIATPEELLLTRSDIGRHNGLDKVFGYCVRNKVKLRDKVIVFSGRLSSEVLLKVSKIGVGVVLSKSAPTTLALDLAEDLGITAVGFIRKNRFNVYTHPERIVED
ncbi:formate dehydrogenase accessory sulfurtransferase FdhD [Alkalicoccus daliensis]|uniref:Sulfur carrier protein FdhD n=1 Tax=Alkalicoccus daliensis TaxID=745820 RepID=A0A1H0K682_9BACI|nr:formate dehydrogenase accessory sulfurtransferase FdhD [Alkalicoccus daliensis]SDO51394.1 FdhD protein [Alkalicoccus daliensis]